MPKSRKRKLKFNRNLLKNALHVKPIGEGYFSCTMRNKPLIGKIVRGVRTYMSKPLALIEKQKAHFEKIQALMPETEVPENVMPSQEVIAARQELKGLEKESNRMMRKLMYYTPNLKHFVKRYRVVGIEESFMLKGRRRYTVILELA